jgi:hypothetical protein
MSEIVVAHTEWDLADTLGRRRTPGVRRARCALAGFFGAVV